MAGPHSAAGSPYSDNDDDYSEAAPLTGSISLVPLRKTPMHFTGQLDALGSLKRSVFALIPSFLTSHTATTPSKSGVAALDGLRGLACLFVFNEHYVICYQSRETQVWIMRVPFIRLLWYGKSAVFIFFVISGYVLSYKPLTLMRTRSYQEFQKVISSSFLRRGMRLYLPCLVVSFILCLLTYMGLFHQSSGIYSRLRTFVYLKEEPPPRLDLSKQFAGYLHNVEFIFSATIPFEKSLEVHDYFMYDEHQWTIPREFQSSMVVFAALVTTSRMRSIFRIATIAALACYAVYTSRLYISLFFAGMVCAELDLIRQAFYALQQNALPEYTGVMPGRGFGVNLRLPDLAVKVFWTALFTLGVFMISSPQEVQATPNLLPTLLRNWGIVNVDDTLLLVGSILTVWSVAACSSLGPIFNNPVVCYLGKISYALYLVHGTVIKSLGYAILPWTLRVATGTPDSIELDLDWWNTVPNYQKVVAYLIGWCCVGPMCFWLSDLFWRFVDMPCVSFARMLESWLTKGADTGPEDLTPDSGSSATAGVALNYRGRAASMGHSAHPHMGGHLAEQTSLLDAVQGCKRKNG